MHGRAHYFGALILSLSVGAGPCSAAPAAAPATHVDIPTTVPLVPAPIPGHAASVDDILTYYGLHFDIIIVKNGQLADQVTVKDAIPENRELAIAMLNDLLAQRGLTTWRVKKGSGSAQADPAAAKSAGDYGDRIILQVLTITEARKKAGDESPVTTGIDPSKIDISQRDRLITHIVPVQNPQVMQAARRAAAEQKDVTLTTIGSAASGYAFALTGPALSVRHALEAITAIDKPPVAKTNTTRSMKLENMDALEAADSINQLFGPNILADQAVHAEGDKRTNSVIITGPEAQVFSAMAALQRYDLQAAPPTLRLITPEAPAGRIVPDAPAPAPNVPPATTVPAGPGGYYEIIPHQPVALDVKRAPADNTRLAISAHEEKFMGESFAFEFLDGVSVVCHC